MKQDSTNANVKRYYESQKISPEKLAHLLEMHEQHEAGEKQNISHEQKKSPTINNFLRKHFAIAASIFVAFIIGTQMFSFLDSDDATLIDRVTKEILLNHQKQFAVEFSNESIPGLRTEMQKLDFSLILSDFIDKT